MSSWFVAWITSFIVCLVLVGTTRWHGHLSLDTDFGVQKTHSHPTPRVGGIGIFLGVLVGLWVLHPGKASLLVSLMMASVPAFAFGVLEDVTKRVGVTARLVATMASGLLGWWITGASITDVNVWGVDWLLAFPLLSVVFTAFAVGGVANALNIIDGFNGLASGGSIIMLLAMATLAGVQGDSELAAMCYLIAGAVAGFLLINWPWGKLFLGDGGAYFVGFCLAWVAVLLLWRHPGLSAWAPLLICGYPVLEVGFSIWRRRKRRLNPGHPDRLHMHSLIKRRVVRRWFPYSHNLARNSITGAMMWGFAALPALCALRWPTHTPALVLCFLLCAFGYSALYARLTQFRWCFRPHTLVPRQLRT